MLCAALALLTADAVACCVHVVQDMPAAGGFANPAAGGWGGAPRQQQQQPMGGGATAFAGAGGGDSCQDAVLAIIQGADNDTGVHVEQVRGEALAVDVGERVGSWGPGCHFGWLSNGLASCLF